jgi:hypothetical protein
VRLEHPRGRGVDLVPLLAVVREVSVASVKRTTYIHFVQLGPESAVAVFGNVAECQSLADFLHDPIIVRGVVRREFLNIHFGGLAVALINHFLITAAKACWLAILQEMGQRIRHCDPCFDNREGYLFNMAPRVPTNCHWISIFMSSIEIGVGQVDLASD